MVETITNQKKNAGLREGYTTGSCAAAAAKGAAFGLFNGFIPDNVEIETPINRTINLKILNKKINAGFAECCVQKDAGDDPDVTNGALIYAKVSFLDSQPSKDISNNKQNSHGPIIRITGGRGVGVVTKPGLQVGIGEPAINPKPRLMIRESVKQVIGDDKRGVVVEISVPDGEKIAERTFNGRLGIVGGISIIGTTGFVKPMSEEAIKTSLKCELSVANAMGFKTVALAPGNLAESAIKLNFKQSKAPVALMSNFVGFMLNEAQQMGFKNIILAGHPGKLAKLIRGDFNTHSSKSKQANDIIINLLESENAPEALIAAAKESTTIEGIIEAARNSGKLCVFDKAADLAQSAASKFLKNRAEIGVILFDMQKSVVGQSKNIQNFKDLYADTRAF